MSLNKARILSSENDASVKQEQNTNVNIKIQPSKSSPVMYPQVPPTNFTIPPQEQGPPSFIPQMQASQFQSPQVIGRDIQLESNDLELKNRFLEVLLSIYEANPLRINSYIVCHSSSLMELIKILTEADKVELVIDEDSGCTGCVSNNRYMTIQRILVTKDDKTNDLKYAYNDVFAQLIKHSISLKLCV